MSCGCVKVETNDERKFFEGVCDVNLSNFSNKNFKNFFFHGSISMNLTTLTSKEPLGKEGDFFSFWENSQELLDFLTLGQKRAHNFLTSFNDRLERKYVYNKKKLKSYELFFGQVLRNLRVLENFPKKKKNHLLFQEVLLMSVL
jgi:hypothetical protein